MNNWQTVEIKTHPLKGRTIRVKCEHSKVHAIGHIVRDDWFNPSEDFAALKESNAKT